VVVSHPKRAALVEQAVQRAIQRHAKAFGFTVPEGLVVLLNEPCGPLGDSPALLEREHHPDGRTRYVLQLALGRPGERPDSGLETALAELGRQLLRLQREIEGIAAHALGDPVGSPGAPAREHDDIQAPTLVPFASRNGRGRGPFDPAPA
jgi:hypothetical protein